MRRPKTQHVKYLDFKVGRLDLSPGDVLVLQTDLILDGGQVKAIRKMFQEQTKSLKLRPPIILTAGLKLGSVRKVR